VLGVVLVEVDKEEQLNEGEDLLGELSPVCLLEEDVDHDNDELADADTPIVQFETVLDPLQYLGLQFLQQIVFVVGVQGRQGFPVLEADLGDHPI
jgi:hypothetical protein